MDSPDAPSACAVRLEAILDLKSAAPLLRDILAVRGQDLALEASDVRRLGGQCLQVLLAAKAAWSQDGHGFEIRDASPAFIEGAALMGAADLLGLSTEQEPCQ